MTSAQQDPKEDARLLALLEGSELAFRKFGVRAPSMDDLAGHLGVSKKTLYKHVKDKADLETFFFKEWLEGVLKTLATLIKISLNKDEFRVMIPQIPPLVAEILYNNIDKKDVHEAVACIFDFKSRLYQYHYLSSENAILTQS